MLDALKTLFENDVVSEEVRTSIEEAWEAKIKENKQAVTAELREEFAKKYEHDKSVMVDAVDAMISERLAEEISEFADDRKQLAEAKAKYAVAMRKNADLMQRFVVESLGKEITELHADQKAMAEKFGMLENFVVESLAKEIAEFYEDKKDLAETKVKLVKEAKTKFAELKKMFVESSANKVSDIVAKTLTKEISQLKEDIEDARKNDFGRKLFEAFASEYATSHLNEKSETAKLMKVVDLKNKQLEEAKVAMAKTIKLAESKDAQIGQMKATAERKDIMNNLIDPLSKDQKEIMSELLESVQTNRLQSAFDKYLPAVIDGKTPAKKATLTEGKEVTGNRDTVSQTNVSSNADDNLIEFKRLAGLN
jgi:adenosyl cobinamide kinase/adenosyl cobinamide phosphate guanylyltransferase